MLVKGSSQERWRVGRGKDMREIEWFKEKDL